jgi:hypothetical protein
VGLRWLITIAVDTELDDLQAKVSEVGGELSHDPPIPLDGDEQVVGATGPADLPARLSAADAAVVKVSPDSELELY